MKRSIVIALTVMALTVVFGSQVYASSSTSLEINSAYLKSNNNYTVVVKDVSNIKLGLYVNDKNPSFASTNRRGWATFTGVALVNGEKVSFTRVFRVSSKTYQKPINYVRYSQVLNGRVVFDKTLTVSVNKAVTPTPVVTTPSPPVTSTPVTTTAPASTPTSCTPLTDGGNCYEPGEYCRDSDHDATGIAGDGTGITCLDNDGWRWEPN
jgi:hypothetical protein